MSVMLFCYKGLPPELDRFFEAFKEINTFSCELIGFSEFFNCFLL